MSTYNKEDVIGRECRHITYSKHRGGLKEDSLTIKEIVHVRRPDGSIEQIPNLRWVPNVKRDFYVTLPAHRNHPDKKEWEDINKLQKFSCRDIELPERVAFALGRTPDPNDRMAILGRSQYLYGTDVTAAVLEKEKYRTKWPDLKTQSTVASLDSETDVLHGAEEIIMLSSTFKDKVIVAIQRNFLKGCLNPIERIQELAKKELKNYIEKNGIENIEIVVVENSAECVVKVIERLHEWKPDFVSIWNIKFDVPKMISALESHGYSLEDVFSDPSVPPAFRRAEWKPGKEAKKTASGRFMPLHWTEQWHNFYVTASFYFVDSGCAFRRIRAAKPKETSYALDYILGKYANQSKLKFDCAKDLSGLDWHIKMQRDHQPEYTVYNIWDGGSLEDLDAKLGDLRLSMPFSIECSEYDKFPSQPRRLCDLLHFVVLKEGKVIAASPDDMEDENDQYVMGMDNIIVTLNSHSVEENGVRLFYDAPDIISLLVPHTSDLDVEGAYPTTEVMCNVSKETTYREPVQIENLSATAKRDCSINMTAARTNAVELAILMYERPSVEEVLKAYDDMHAIEGEVNRAA